MTAPAEEIVCVGGRFIPAAAATIPALDSGFLYGDGVFDTLLVLGGRAVDGERHRARLAAAAAALGIELPDVLDDRISFARLIEELAAANRLEGAAGCRVSVSRGPRAPGPLAPPVGPPTWVASAFPVAPPLAAPAAARVGLATDLVFAPAPWTRMKTLSSLFRVLGRAEASRRGCDDVIFADSGGRLAEATSHHLFLRLASGGWATPPLSLGILPGITRAFVLGALGGDALERDIATSDALLATAGFLTGSLRGVWPIASIDGRPLDAAACAPVRRLWVESLSDRSR